MARSMFDEKPSQTWHGARDVWFVEIADLFSVADRSQEEHRNVPSIQ